MHELGAEARSGEEPRAGFPRGRGQTAFLGELAARGLVRRLARLERPGRDLEQRLAGRVPPLADHRQPLAVPGEDRGRTGMLDDLARRSMAVGTLDLVDPDRDPLAGPRPRAADRPLLHAEEPTPRRSGHGPRTVNPARMRATCSSPSTLPDDRGDRPRQGLRDPHRGPRPDLHRRRWRDLRPARTERRRQDDERADAGRADRADDRWRDDQRDAARHRLAADPRGIRDPHGVPGPPRSAHRAAEPRLLRAALRAPRRDASTMRWTDISASSAWPMSATARSAASARGCARRSRSPARCSTSPRCCTSTSRRARSIHRRPS